jgi:dimethylargininase
MLMAITRQVSRSIVNCELTYLAREPIDVNRARLQHAQYENALKSLGLAVLSLPEIPDLPDSVFVEDTALVLDECAIITRPGALSRQPEIDPIRKVLSPYRELRSIQAPGRIDGGDILRVGKQIYIGLSQRSDTNAMEQLQEFVKPFGYEVQAVSLTGCLHLKSAATEVAQDTLLINPAWVDPHQFKGVRFIEVDASESHAANALRIHDSIIHPSSYPRTQQRLANAGIHILSVEVDELAKAEGAVTCCSLILEV